MRGKFLKLIVVVFFLSICVLQISARKIYSTAGNNISTQHFTGVWAVGDVAIETDSTTNFVLTHGFCQSFTSKLDIKPEETDNITFFPVPTRTELNIVSSDQTVDVFEIYIYNEFGVVVALKEVKGAYGTASLDVSELPPSIYILKVYDKETSKLIGTKKITKL